MIKIGFYGTECYDIIHYLARYLSLAGKKVALIDSSNNQSLKYSIPQVEGVENYIFYDGIAFFEDFDRLNEQQFDFLIVYADNERKTNAVMDRQIYHTDFQLHNIMNIVKHREDGNKRGMDRCRETLLVRDSSQENRFRYVVSKCTIPAEDCHFIVEDGFDRMFQLSMQYHDRSSLKKVSEEIIYYIEELGLELLLIGDNSLEWTSKELKMYRKWLIRSKNK